MIEQGWIMTLSDPWADIRPKSFLETSAGDSSACFGCMNQECKRRPGLVRVENPLRLPLKIGQLVETEASAPSLGIQATLALGPPILGFLAGYSLSGLAGSWGDPFRAFCGMAALLVSAGIVYLIRRRFPPKNLPQIRRIIE